jgi:hypothetical protein
LDDLSEFRMPKLLEISPNARKRLSISLNCCDGFAGREVRPTGKLISMARPRHHRKRSRAGFTLVPALILVSQRSFGDNIQNSQEHSGQNDVCTTNSNSNNNRPAITAGDVDHLPEKMVANRAKVTRIARINHDRQLDVSQQMRQRQRMVEDEGNNPKTAQNPIPPLKSILKSRVTFIDDEKVLQSLSMVSAPISNMTSDASDSSDEGTDDRECTNSDTTDEDRSTESKDDEKNRGSDLDIDEETEVNQSTGSALFPQPTTPKRVALQQMVETEDAFAPSSDITVTQAVQRLALSGEFILHDGINAVFEDLFNPEMIDDDSCIQRCPRQETPKKTVVLCQKLDATDQLPWMPRRPVSTRCLIEVDEEIDDDTSSPIATRLSRSPVQAGNAVRSWIDQNRLSQGSIELGDPNWSAPCCQTEEALDFQAQSPEGSSAKCRAINQQDSFVRAIQQPFHVLSRSTSVPLISRSPHFAEVAQVEHLGADFTSTQSFRPVISPRRPSLSQPLVGTVRATNMRAIMRSMNVEAGTTPVRGRVRSLPLNPPFLRA